MNVPFHPFQFGVNTTSAPSREAWIGTAQKAEALGFHSLLVADHLGNQLGPTAALVAAAAATTTLRVGSFVFGNDFRHPVYLAQEAATIDLLSGGRFELGLGTGWMRSDYDLSGIPFDPPGTRVSRLIEAVQIIKGFFADALLLEQGQVDEATAVYRADLGLEQTIYRPMQHPNNVWSLHGYVTCLERQRNEAEAAAMRPRLAVARADVEISASCFCALGGCGCSD